MDSLALRAEKDPEGAATVRLLRVASRSVDAGVVSLVPTPSIRGQVLGPAGEPVGGALVRPLGILSLGEILFEVVPTENDGTFLLPCGKPGARTRVIADLEGFAPAVGLGVCGGEPVTLRLEEGATVRGTVRSAKGEPLAGARVALDLYLFNLSHSEGWFPDDSPRNARSGPDGSYELTHLPPGSIQIRAVETGHDLARGGIKLSNGESGTVDFSLRPVGTLSGFVVDAVTGAPVEGATVNRGEAASGPDGRFVAKRERDWRFVGHREEFLYAWVEKPGYAGQRARLPLDRAGEELRVLLRPVARIRGIVLDPEGRALWNAKVDLEPDWRVAHDPDADTMQSEHAFTGPDGSFSAEIAPGPYTKIYASHERYPAIERPGITVASGEAADLILVLGEGSEVRGWLVRGDTGAPVPAARVRGWREYRIERFPPGWIASCETRTAADGSFSLRGFRETSLWISAEAPGCASAAREVALPEDGPAGVEWRLDPELVLEGEVRDPGGALVAESYVSCELDAAPPLPKILGPFWVKTDAAGRFRIGGLPSLPLRASATAPYGPGPRLEDSETVPVSPPFPPIRLVLRERSRR
ncbi:MAG: carboxypeptidase-like regulatory domain-containing protein [Planctomycetes bacterium]|nr:carboxypeptidase-like regulatory domain-containing protein [Planctomycetota bacterium]